MALLAQVPCMLIDFEENNLKHVCAYYMITEVHLKK